MPLVQNVFMKDVWRQVGKKTHVSRFIDGLQPSLVTASQYGLLLHWPKLLTFLSVAAQHRDKINFGRGQQAFETIAFDVGGQSPESSFLEGRHILVANVLRSDAIKVAFVVDTDDPVFWQLAIDAYEKGEKEVRVTISVMAFANGLTEDGHINLVLSPAAPVARYNGFVALDVGNTASALVSLPKGIAQLQTKAIQVLDANEERPGSLKDAADPVVSHVRIDSATDFSDSPSSVRWVVGRMASTGTDGLVVGPKRLVAGKNWEETQVFNAKQKVVLPRRIPAELLVCKILQRFREATSEQPDEVALTYPTTYEPRELNQLREVVYRGFQRSRWYSQAHGKNEEKVKANIPVVLDEASAAAYFFLYQKILEAPGGLPRFRYLYPNGLNLLLYDCGGGTTDIALVNAHSESGSSKLVIGVKSRSGLRGFGGDNITEAVFRVLKAKLALEMCRLTSSKELAGPAFPDKPVTGAELEKRLRADQQKFDRFVPTMFDREVMDDENRQRRNYSLDLWQWAEALKCKLEEGTSAALESANVAAGKGKGTLWEQLLGKFGSDDVRVKDAIKALQRIKINRWEVDCQVQDDLVKSIENCNELIRTKLTEVGQEVHWVVASGNGARYPLIQELLKKRLDVQFIDDHRFTLDIANLKHAVAKGAVLYLMALRAQKKLQVEFDTDLSNCLPYDVVYHDPVTNTYPILFHEHDHYTKICAAPQLIEATQTEQAAALDVRTRRIDLGRRWPGDGDNYSPYLGFEFEEEVQFPVEVSFNPELKQFEVKDATGAIGTRHEESDRKLHESPVQRGDL